MVQAPEMQKSRKIVQYILLFLSLFSFELMSQLFCSFELNRGNFPPDILWEDGSYSELCECVFVLISVGFKELCIFEKSAQSIFEAG